MNQVIRLLISLLLVVSAFSACINNCATCTTNILKCDTCSQGYLLKADKSACLLDYVNQASWPTLCATGTKQSPINMSPFMFPLCPTANQFYHTVVPNNVTIRPDGQNLGSSFVNYSKISLVVSGVVNDYMSTEFRWHSPSEHQIMLKTLDLEWQIVHKMSTDSTKVAITSLLFKRDEYAETDIFDQYNLLADGTDHNFTFPFNLKESMVYHYPGSDTVPPCTENVEWFIYTEYFPITKTNYYKLKTAINGNKANVKTKRAAGTRAWETIGGFCNVSYL